jgi:hypothetical protein
VGVVEAAREEVLFAGAMEGEELCPALVRVPFPAVAARLVAGVLRGLARGALRVDARSTPGQARSANGGSKLPHSTGGWCRRVAGVGIQERFLDD